jgi:hypothetical protein
VWSVISQSRLVDAASAPRREQELAWAGCANLSFSRSILNDVGLFDTTFPFRLGGDDVDLCLRIRATGSLLIASPRALVFHDRAMWSSWSAILRRAFRWGRVEYHLCQRHPQFRQRVFPRFWVVLVLLGFVAMCKIFLTFEIRWFWLPLFWAGLSLCLYATFDVLSERLQMSQIMPRVLSAVPELTYQLGICFEALRRMDPGGLLYGHFPLSDWATVTWRSEFFNTWANLIAILGAFLGVIYLC